MLEYIPMDILIPYEALCLFLFYQSMHSSTKLMEKNAELTIGISITLGVITNFVFLILLGINTIWWAPFILILLFIPTLIVGIIIEKVIGRINIVLIGFLGWPICAYLLFKQM